MASISDVGAGVGVGIASNISRTAVSTMASTSGVGATGGGVSATVDALSSLVQAAATTVPNSKMSIKKLVSPDSPPKIVGMAFVGLQQVWGVNRGVDRALRGVSERIGNG